MTFDSSPAARREPGWYAVTAQGVIVSGPHTRGETADIAWDDTVTALRHELEGARKPEDFVAVRLAAVTVTVAYRVQVGACNLERLREAGGTSVAEPTIRDVITALAEAGIGVDDPRADDVAVVTRRRDGSQVVLTAESEGVRLAYFHGSAAEGDRRARTWEPTVAEVVARVGTWYAR